MLIPTWRPPSLETPRLLLRPIEESDATAVFLYACNPKVSEFTLWDTHETIENSLFFVREYARSRYQEGVPDPYGIILKSDPDQMVVGSVGCYWASKPDGVMELGYHLAEPYWGRGFTTEAARVVVDHTFANYPVERIHARVFVGNVGSSRVAEKVGMKLEGVHRAMMFRKGRRWDIEMYALLRGEWDSKQRKTEE